MLKQAYHPIMQVSLQISVHRRLTQFQLELDHVSRSRHGEVLDVSRMSGLEREVRAVFNITTHR
jgi:hypothetical protein